MYKYAKQYSLCPLLSDNTYELYVHIVHAYHSKIKADADIY